MEYIILIVSLAGIVFGADYLVAGTVSIARRLKISDFVIGAVIVGIGTSMPELVVSTIGAIEGNADVAIGNVVGSNIFNILGILGLTAVFFPIAVSRTNLKFELPVCIGVSVILTLLTFNFFNGSAPVISRVDGWILLLCFGVFIWYSLHRDRSKMKEAPAEKSDYQKNAPLFLTIVKIVGGLALLILSCDIFIDKAVLIAKELGVNEAFISLTLISCGTSLPELAASITAALRKNTQLAMGNVIGSNIFNITWILGLSSQVMPLNSSGITSLDYIVMTTAAILPLIFGFRGKIGRIPGALMVVGFVLYTWNLLNAQIG